jgi:hypothetical protein
MKSICRRCSHFIKHRPHLVRKEENGLVLLDMLVCAKCARLAKQLGIPVVKTGASASDGRPASSEARRPGRPAVSLR